MHLVEQTTKLNLLVSYLDMQHFSATHFEKQKNLLLHLFKEYTYLNPAVQELVMEHTACCC